MNKFKPYVDDIWLDDSYAWEQPWLEHTDNRCARYTVCKHHDGLWYAKWWHGNRGYNLGKRKTLEEAKKVCVEHLQGMYRGIEVELKSGIGGVLQEWLRDLASCWCKDERLLSSEGIEALAELFKLWMKENKELVLEWLEEAKDD
ncbi:MAG: hypothetical protein DRJ03_28310 [Chloroflexi bacterium]|nr:MAG: hypothetical protein DRJ03_28310 [Chloroflexota bacterium]